MNKTGKLFSLWFMTLFVILFAFGSFVSSVALAETAGRIPDESAIVDGICTIICNGNFEAAGRLIKFAGDNEFVRLKKLAEIIKEYEELARQRQEAKHQAYAKELDKLRKFQSSEDANDIKDFNDVNDIIMVLSVIANTLELSNEQQKNELLAMPFVQKTIFKSIEKASEYESRGKWLDAYLNCYSWLKFIYKDSEAYSDYAEQLVEKANIVASFQDSPCETSKERYKDVKKKMFTRSIDALKHNYVNPIDYREMANKAIKRCELLGEVMRASFADISKEQTLITLGKDSSESFWDLSPNQKQLSSWRSGLTKISMEINRSITSISKDKFIDIFERILELNKITMKLPETVLIAQFSEGALSALDPHTTIVWPKATSEFEKAMTNTFTGIGIRLGKEKGLLSVASLLPDTPAYHSGLDAGDIIEKVDGVETKNMTTICAVKMITGPAGTNVTLTIKRPANGKAEDEIMDIIITRDKIVVPSIRGWQQTKAGKILYMLDEENKIGYIRIAGFDSETAFDFEKALNQLESEGLKALVVDLRSNPGGFLNAAAAVADKFIRDGVIVTTRPRFGIWTVLSARKEKTHPDYPLAILINSISASASEIVAGALQDPKYKRGTVIGDRSHGKGSVQSITTYPGEGAQLKYTMAYYYLPSGQKVESRDAMKKQGRKDWGIGPDIEVKLTKDEIIKMVDVQWENMILVRADHNIEAEPLKKHSAEDTIAADPQLATALLVLRAKMIQQKCSTAARLNYSN